eukprot:scaffold84806_cov21-Prasinocladus_malaysianus.AAC.1
MHDISIISDAHLGLLVGDYRQAVVKFDQALRLLSPDSQAATHPAAGPSNGSSSAVLPGVPLSVRALVLRIMKAVEENPPADMDECERLVSAMFKSAQ